MKLIKMQIAKLKAGKFQPRTKYDKEDSEKLLESLKADSKNAYVEIDDQNNIIDGHNLTSACKKLGKKDVWCLVKDFNGDETEKLLSAIRSNAVRKNLSGMDMAKNIMKIKNKLGLKYHRDIAKVTGLSEHQIGDLFDLYDMKDDLKKVSGSLTKSQVTETAGLEKKDRIEVLKKASRDGIGNRTLRNLAQTVKKAPEQVKRAILNDEITPDEAKDVMEIKDPHRQKEAIETTKRHKEEAKKHINFVKKRDKEKGAVKIKEKSQDELIAEAVMDLLRGLNQKTFDVGKECDKMIDFLEDLYRTAINSPNGVSIRIIKNLKPQMQRDILDCLKIMTKRVDKMMAVKEKIIKEM